MKRPALAPTIYERSGRTPLETPNRPGFGGAAAWRGKKTRAGLCRAAGLHPRALNTWRRRNPGFEEITDEEVIDIILECKKQRGLKLMPKISKLKDSDYWLCDGVVGKTPAEAYRAWRGTDQPTTRRCPKCGNERLGQMRSQKLKYCPDCHHWMDWELDSGQQPLLGPARPRRKAWEKTSD